MSWWETYVYAAWLGGRLPTEAEWEYAAKAKGGCPSGYCLESGEKATVDDLAWYLGNSKGTLHPVMEQGADGTPIRKANQHGLYDIYGNAWEWVMDRYAEYPSEPQRDPLGAAVASTGRRVIRGGSFDYGGVLVRSANRLWNVPGGRSNVVGFRVALPAPCGDSSGDPGS